MVEKRSWNARNENNTDHQHRRKRTPPRCATFGDALQPQNTYNQAVAGHHIPNEQATSSRASILQREFYRPRDIFDAFSDGQTQRKPDPGESCKTGGLSRAWVTPPLERIGLFTQLSYELEHDPTFIQEFRRLTGDACSDQALALAKKLNSYENLLFGLAHQQLPTLPHQPTTPRECKTLSEWFDKYPDHLPALPPIQDAEMEAKVFTAPSFLQHGERGHQSSYERLEWLGDAYLELITRRIIFNIVVDTSEALPATITQDFVRNENLARYALAYGFDERLRLSPKHIANTSTSTRKAMTKTYGDIFEAYVAALIESDPVAGYKTAYSWLSTLIKPTILKYTNRVPINPLAKEELARKVLGKGIRIEWEEHQKPTAVKGGMIYYYSAFLTGWGYQKQLLGSGQGPSKSQAQIWAAMEALTNPTTAVICALKREYDALVKVEREKEGGPDAEIIAALNKKYKEIPVE
ncbi:MAG: hypothetical protein GOMPHAMPRED_007969 [Gomphillus americanus]|uniref:RNase III domain-containing protein n=1 Tax=Gomphillus americanus TaxID=1940652 RepID=A0A8H3EVV5_9LECA|nr:MAG: hypothetical protein GOMPHAMPRED_007969 [Gomphillus americanus]